MGIVGADSSKKRLLRNLSPDVCAVSMEKRLLVVRLYFVRLLFLFAFSEKNVTTVSVEFCGRWTVVCASLGTPGRGYERTRGRCRCVCCFLDMPARDARGISASCDTLKGILV